MFKIYINYLLKMKAIILIIDLIILTIEWISSINA